MHLCGPALTTTGKKKGKKKFASAEAARQSRELDASWQEIMNKYSDKKVVKEIKKTLKDVYKLDVPAGRSTSHIPSRDTGFVPCVKAPDKVYTGTAIKGIGTMHKSNAVPVFSNEQAQDIAKMRR